MGPSLPDHRFGGGVALFELLAWLVDCVKPLGAVAVVAPVAEPQRPDLARLASDPSLPGVHWHPLAESRLPGLPGYVSRLLGPLPSDAAKVATLENAARLEAIRRDFRPTIELAVSSWALAAYRGQVLSPGTRLVMVNFDPDVVRFDGPWFQGVWPDTGTFVRKLACAIDRPKVRRLCRHALATAARVGAFSPADVTPLNSLGGRNDTVHLPPLIRPRPVDRSAVIEGTVLITTNFAYQPNVTSLDWFLREVWPHVAPRAELTVTGVDPQGVGSRLCRRHTRVRFTGLLGSAELDAAFARTAVAVNPTRVGGGFQMKLLDAIARGVPIVSTTWSNKFGPAIPSSDDPRELANLITVRLTPGPAPIAYASYFAAANAAWEAFLFDDEPLEPSG